MQSSLRASSKSCKLRSYYIFNLTGMMRYLNQDTITQLGIDWAQIINVINTATTALRDGDFSQPVKPYLRYKDLKNRIIAMPAYIGGEFGTAGIKWIASFPNNIHQNMPRAHSVIILNEENTGKPIAIINTALVSGIRTSGVTGAVIDKYLSIVKPTEKINFGIIGFGPIGRLHLEMICSLFASYINKVFIYDINPNTASQIPTKYQDKVVVVNKWEEAFDQSQVFVTCTVSSDRYIDREAPKGSLQLNVSLRDYKPAFLKQVDVMVVDHWEEVCRENTDIERMHIEYGLQEENTRSIADVLVGDGFAGIDKSQVVMFNPMGMAIFDMAIGKYYYSLATSKNCGVTLED